MNEILTGLGVPAELQALFNHSECLFDFGDGYEHFGKGFHRVPTSQNAWRCSPDCVTDVIITHSAMEAIAYITLNRHLHSSLSNIAFIAIGNYPHALQTDWIRNTFKKRKITLVFSSCILGVLADIRLVAGLQLLPVKMQLAGRCIKLQCKGITCFLEQDSISLHKFEKTFGIRSGMKTSKPKNYLTYLDQLLANGKHKY